MRMRLLVVALALCALAFVGMTGPPEVAPDMRMNFSHSSFLSEPASPAAASLAAHAVYVVDNDAGAGTTAALVVNLYTYAHSSDGSRTAKEDSALPGPRVSGRYAQMRKHLYLDSRLRAGPQAASLTTNTPRVLRT